MGADPDFAHTIGQHHIAQRAGEGLFFDMGVHQRAIGDPVAGVIEEFPAVCEMVPACVGVRHGHIKAPAHARA